jgi:hypothetical protein
LLKAIPLVEAESLAFFDVEGSAYGIAGPQVAVMVNVQGHVTHGTSNAFISTEGPSHWSANLQTVGGSFDLQWKATEALAALDSNDVAVCNVEGTLADAAGKERPVRCLGFANLASRPAAPPVLRSVAAVFGPNEAVALNAYKPAVYHGHGDERNDAVVFEDGEPIRVQDARLSTVYSKDDLHVQASLELWTDEEFPRRMTGEAIEGSHVELTDRDVAFAFYRWTLGPHEGVGYYEIALAAPPRVAA